MLGLFWWLIASTCVVRGQLSCDPLNATKCPPVPGLPTSTFAVDFTKQTSVPQGWILDNWANVTFGPEGARYWFEKPGNAPYMWTDFYVAYGRIDVELLVARGTGIITAAVMFSDTKDEIDWEFSGSNFGNTSGKAFTNYFGKGVTGIYNRGTKEEVEEPQAKFHTYSFDWTPEQLVWLIDNKVVRTMANTHETTGAFQFPQTPSRLHVGIWDAGTPKTEAGTVNWAGGYTNYSELPFSAIMRSMRIVTPYPCQSWEYPAGFSGFWKDVRCVNATQSSRTTYSSMTTQSITTSSTTIASITTTLTTTSSTTNSLTPGSSTASLSTALSSSLTSPATLSLTSATTTTTTITTKATNTTNVTTTSTGIASPSLSSSIPSSTPSSISKGTTANVLSNTTSTSTSVASSVTALSSTQLKVIPVNTSIITTPLSTSSNVQGSKSSTTASGTSGAVAGSTTSTATSHLTVGPSPSDPATSGSTSTAKFSNVSVPAAKASNTTMTATTTTSSSPVITFSGIPRAWKYRGCWTDPATIWQRALNVWAGVNWLQVNNHRCVAACDAQGYKFAGTEYAWECWCGNVLFNSTRRPESECSKKCITNPNEPCGNGFRLTLWTKGEYWNQTGNTEPAPSPHASVKSSSSKKLVRGLNADNNSDGAERRAHAVRESHRHRARGWRHR